MRHRRTSVSAIIDLDLFRGTSYDAEDMSRTLGRNAKNGNSFYECVVCRSGKTGRVFHRRFGLQSHLPVDDTRPIQ